MYRHYEDPRKVRDMVAEAREEMERMIEGGESEEAIYDQHCWLEELKERENFAWQDEEYDENYELYGE